ncbi:MAG TPA: glutathione-disulfide reductase [Dyella sp.]|uniref:glutathione-disulfide reductase n=1 Tax=Dyella sp. TaxID=1869338 RepID=UPI002F93D94A
MAERFDLIVLGAGSGGLATAIRAARHGARVAMLDPGALGGTCVNVGCVPKKALWFAAQLAHAQALATEYGFSGTPGAFDWEHFRHLRAEYIDGIKGRYLHRLSEVGVQWLPEAGRFVAADTIATSDGDELSANHIVIATGARPHRLSVPGFELGMVSDDMFALPSRPDRIAIVGGGYIGLEFAGLLNALGSKVTVYARGRLLGGFDTEMVDALERRMTEQGVTFSPNVLVKGLRSANGELYLDDAVSGEGGPYDALLWAVGRVPNTESLDLDAVGVGLGKQGRILVDAWQNTNVAGIYAVGDVCENRELTPVAVAAGRRLADRLFGGQPDSRLEHKDVASVVFAEPPLAMVGMTEEQARAMHGPEVRVYRSTFSPLQWAVVKHPGKTLMKVICVGAEERVAGIHVLGLGAEEMMQGFAVALKLGVRKRDLDNTVAIHPSSAEELVLMT